MTEDPSLITSPDAQERAAARGAEPALIEHFEILGLYGYRDISLSSKYAATVLIAKNGTGKTTLLGALDALLRLQLSRLRGLEFSEIKCRLRGTASELSLRSDDLAEFLEFSNSAELTKLANRIGIEPLALFDFLMGDFKSALLNVYNDNDHKSPANLIGRAFSYNSQECVRVCQSVFESLFERNARISFLHREITTRLSEYEILYLPTYRRVELALSESKDDIRLRRTPRPRFSIATSGLHTGDIQFGLSDISDRLGEINGDILKASNAGYREISENIINELIRGYEVDENAPKPKPEDLKLFFSRIEANSRRMGPSYPISAPDFERIYSGEGVPAESRKFLAYFLGKLSNIIDITKDIESPVEEFILTCNRYLASIEPSTSVNRSGETIKIPVDGKSLVLNRTDLSVHVESLPNKRPITLDALSSGEKQMISLFAKMYLYPKKKVVLIDEPELSLSIDWQRDILVDVLLSPLCEQVVSITHSPFIFDNSLEPFARTLQTSTSEQPGLDLEDAD